MAFACPNILLPEAILVPDAVATLGPGCEHIMWKVNPTNVGFLGAMLAIFTNAWDFGDGNPTKAPALGLQKGSEKGWMYKDGVKFATFHNMKVIVLDLIPKKY